MDISQIPDDVVNIMPNDTTVQPGIGFQVAVGGDVTITKPGGTTVILPACIAGLPYIMRFEKIMATGTTASGTIAVYRGR